MEVGLGPLGLQCQWKKKFQVNTAMNFPVRCKNVKLCTRSKRIYQYLYFASVYRVYSVNIDNIDVNM
jgi:hypothetical protein